MVIAVRDEVDVVEAQLDALLAQEWDAAWEIIVADNGSTDGTLEMLERYAARTERVRLVDASDTPGASHARNVGIRAAGGDALAFCDADDLVEPGWVAAMGEGLREHPAITGPLPVDRLNPAWVQNAYYSEPPTGVTRFCDIFPFAATANLGVTRSVLDAIGDFDESLPTGEDIDFCLRLWDAGYDLSFRDDAAVQYRYRASVRALWRRTRSYSEAAPAIVKRMAERGHPTPSALAGLRQWVWLVRRLGLIRSCQGRARWVVVAATKVGRLVGSVRHRRVLL